MTVPHKHHCESIGNGISFGTASNKPHHRTGADLQNWQSGVIDSVTSPRSITLQWLLIANSGTGVSQVTQSRWSAPPVVTSYQAFTLAKRPSAVRMPNTSAEWLTNGNDGGNDAGIAPAEISAPLSGMRETFTGVSDP